MAIQHAILFLRNIDEQPALRDSLYAAHGSEELFGCLAKAGYPFSGAEFEEAVDHLHVSCKEYKDADELFTKVNWFRMVSANA